MTRQPTSESIWHSLSIPEWHQHVREVYAHWRLLAHHFPVPDARWDALLALVGLTFLLVSWRHYRAVVMANCAALGWYFGMYLVHWSFVAAVAAALAGTILGLLLVPVMQATAMVAGGLIGCLGGIALWHWFHQPPDFRWVPAAVGLVLLCVAGLYLFRLGVVVLCTLEGALLGVGGLLGVMVACAKPGQNRSLHAQLLDHPIRLFMLVAAVTAVSMVYQYVRWRTAKNDGKGEKK